MVLICSSLTNGVEHWSTCLLSICAPFSGQCQFTSFVHFTLGYLSLCCGVLRVLHTSQILNPYQMNS